MDIGLGEFASNLTGYTRVVANLMLLACVILGIALFSTGVVQLFMHRHNPKLIPLMTPIIYVVLGILTLMVPFFGKIFGPHTVSLNYQPKYEEIIKKNKVTPHIYDIDEPIPYDPSVDDR